MHLGIILHIIINLFTYIYICLGFIHPRISLEVTSSFASFEVFTASEPRRPRRVHLFHIGGLPTHVKSSQRGGPGTLITSEIMTDNGDANSSIWR
jgi:hypothetical protein